MLISLEVKRSSSHFASVKCWDYSLRLLGHDRASCTLSPWTIAEEDPGAVREAPQSERKHVSTQSGNSASTKNDALLVSL